MVEAVNNQSFDDLLKKMLEGWKLLETQKEACKSFIDNRRRSEVKINSYTLQPHYLACWPRWWGAVKAILPRYSISLSPEAKGRKDRHKGGLEFATRLYFIFNPDGLDKVWSLDHPATLLLPFLKLIISKYISFINSESEARVWRKIHG